MPLPNTSMVHPAWSAHHQGPVKTAMRSRVEVLLPSTGARGGDDDLTWPPPEIEEVEPLAEIRARIAPLAEGEGYAPSNQENHTQRFLVQVPVDTGIDFKVGDSGHRLRVTQNPGNPLLIGQEFSIVGYPIGTESFNGNLVCIANVSQEQGR